MEADKHSSSSSNCFVHLLVILFGVSSFVAVIGLWAELPILVKHLPEAWQLSSYIMILNTVAFLGPILYIAARKIWSQKVLEIPLIYSSLAVVILACALLSIFWDYTTTIFGNKHSTAFLVLTFLIFCVDNNSTLLYLPFMANFKEQYVVSYMIGCTIGGCIPAFLGLAQGVGGSAECRNVSVTMNSTSNVTEYVVEPYYSPPRFSAKVFYACVCGQMVISWIAFVLLNTLPLAKRERVSLTHATLSTDPALVENYKSNIFSTVIEKKPSPETNLLGKPLLSKSQAYLLYTIHGFLCIIHDGVLHSVQTYSVLPYGGLAYSLTVNLPRICNPLCCFIAMFVSTKNMNAVAGLTVIATGCGAYLFSLALLSPNPPLLDIQFGAILVVIVSVLESGAVSLLRVYMASLLRRSGGQLPLYKYGIVTLVGTAIGSITMFLLLQLTDIFQSIAPCT